MPKTLTAERSPKELAVLNAARSIFLEHGFSAATTDMIQREAGVSKATMYACFPSKEALFTAVMEQECAATTQSIQAFETLPGNLAQTLIEIGRAYLNVVLSPHGMALYRVIAAEAPRFPELGRRFYLAGPNAVISSTAKQISKAVQAGEIDAHEIGVDAAASLFISMVRGHAQMEAVTHPETRASAAQVDHWAQLATSTFLAAFSTPKAKTSKV